MEANTEQKYGGELLREWRAAEGLSNAKAAELFGVSKARVSQLENDQAEGPGWELANLIERETAGAVPHSAWRKKFSVMVDSPAADPSSPVVSPPEAA